MPGITTNYGYDDKVVMGLADLRKKLLELPKRIGNNVIRRGLVAGAGVIRDEARRLAPQPPAKSRRGNTRTGALKKSIKAESRGVFKSASGVPVGHRAVVMIDKKERNGKSPRRYAHMVEFGTRPHAVGKGSLTASKRSKGGQFGAQHPGSRPQPFMRPAFDTKKLAAMRAITEKVRTELDKELVKMRSGPQRKRA